MVASHRIDRERYQCRKRYSLIAIDIQNQLLYQTFEKLPDFLPAFFLGVFLELSGKD